MRSKILYYLIICAVFFCGCTHKETYTVTPAQLSNGPFTTYKNVLYGTDTTQQILDIYLPQVRDTVSTPIIILIHGGAWTVGDKTDFNGSGLDTFFTGKGCAVAIINYRLAGNYKYPAAFEDMGLVMDFLRKKASAWQINPNRVCMLGKSSGSQLALLYAYSQNPDHRVKAVIDGYGPTDFVDTSITNGALAPNVTYLLGPYTSNQQSWQSASPIFYISGAVPTVIIQGTLDVEVDPIQSDMLQDSLNAHGMPCYFISWVGDGHGWDQVKWEQNKDQVWNWVKYFL